MGRPHGLLRGGLTTTLEKIPDCPKPALLGHPINTLCKIPALDWECSLSQPPEHDLTPTPRPAQEPRGDHEFRSCHRLGTSGHSARDTTGVLFRNPCLSGCVHFLWHTHRAPRSIPAGSSPLPFTPSMTPLWFLRCHPGFRVLHRCPNVIFGRSMPGLPGNGSCPESDEQSLSATSSPSAFMPRVCIRP